MIGVIADFKNRVDQCDLAYVRHDHKRHESCDICCVYDTCCSFHWLVILDPPLCLSLFVFVFDRGISVAFCQVVVASPWGYGIFMVLPWFFHSVT